DWKASHTGRCSYERGANYALPGNPGVCLHTDMTGEQSVTQVKIADYVGKQKLLVTRSSARSLAEALLRDVAAGHQLELDFEGVDGLTPSFLDELLGAIATTMAPKSGRSEILFRHPPTRLSSKFAAVGKARGFEVSERDGDYWALTAA